MLVGLTAGSLYSFFSVVLLSLIHDDVQASPVFLGPVVLGAIPALFSTKQQLKAYLITLLLPWMIVFTCFMLCFTLKSEGALIIAIVVAPVLLLGALAVFIFQTVRLKLKGNGTKLYV